MNKARKILICSCALIGAVAVAISAFQEPKKEPTPIKPPANDGVVSYVDTEDTPSVPKEQEKVSVWVMGDHLFEANDYTLFESGKWEAKLPDDVRFVLIPHESAVTPEQTTLIQKWISEQKTVLFYGFDVDPASVKEKINLPEMDVVDVKSDMALPYLLYGFGFSEVHQQNMPVFLSSNTNQNLNEKIATFLFKENDY